MGDDHVSTGGELDRRWIGGSRRFWCEHQGLAEVRAARVDAALQADGAPRLAVWFGRGVPLRVWLAAVRRTGSRVRVPFSSPVRTRGAIGVMGLPRGP